jgi:hypothetical protein
MERNQYGISVRSRDRGLTLALSLRTSDIDDRVKGGAEERVSYLKLTKFRAKNRVCIHVNENGRFQSRMITPGDQGFIQYIYF